MTIYRICDIELRAGEVVVSAVSHRDYIIVITDRGAIYKLFPERGV